MRPTFLQFRSPKEQTGEFLNPTLTNDGKSLKPQSIDFSKSTFPKGQRWEHIRELTCRTSYKIGPGCYKSPLSTNKGKATKIMKDTATTTTDGYDFLYVGNTILKRENKRDKLTPSRTQSAVRSNRTSSSPKHPNLTTSFYDSPKLNLTDLLKPRSTRPLSAEKRAITLENRRSNTSPNHSNYQSRLKRAFAQMSYNAYAKSFYH
jgi:hypothetical protein